MHHTFASLLKLTGVALLVVGLVLYVGYQFRGYLTGPQVAVTELRVRNNHVSIVGRAENISKLTLFGREIFIDEAGAFREEHLLAPGYNVITLEAEDRFGRSRRVEYPVAHQ